MKQEPRSRADYLIERCEKVLLELSKARPETQKDMTDLCGNKAYLSIRLKDFKALEFHTPLDNRYFEGVVAVAEHLVVTMRQNGVEFTEVNNDSGNV